MQPLPTSYANPHTDQRKAKQHRYQFSIGAHKCDDPTTTTNEPPTAPFRMGLHPSQHPIPNAATFMVICHSIGRGQLMYSGPSLTVRTNATIPCRRDCPRATQRAFNSAKSVSTKTKAGRASGPCVIQTNVFCSRSGYQISVRVPPGRGIDAHHLFSTAQLPLVAERRTPPSSDAACDAAAHA